MASLGIWSSQAPSNDNFCCVMALFTYTHFRIRIERQGKAVKNLIITDKPDSAVCKRENRRDVSGDHSSDSYLFTRLHAGPIMKRELNEPAPKKGQYDVDGDNGDPKTTPNTEETDTTTTTTSTTVHHKTTIEESVDDSGDVTTGGNHTELDGTAAEPGDSGEQNGQSHLLTEIPIQKPSEEKEIYNFVVSRNSESNNLVCILFLQM